MRLVRIAIWIGVSLGSGAAFAATAASYFNFSLRENRYLSDPGQERQGDSYTVYGADLNLESQSSAFNFKLNPVFQGAFESGDEFYAGVPEVYVQPRKIAPGFNLTIGRIKRQWSRLDEEFNVGIWQPQLRWDYLSPQQEGLVGVFFDWSLSSSMRFSFFTSPIFIPDQGPEFQLRNGKFTSANRWFVAPTSRVSLFQNTPYASDAPLYFELDRPSEEGIFLHSSFGFSFNYQPGGPYWTQLSYAFKPRNQIHLGIECSHCGQLPTESNPLEITAVIHPKVVHHNVMTWEAGFDNIDDRGWISLTGDVPQSAGFPDTYAETPMNPSLTAGFAYQHFMGHWVGLPSWLQYSYMRIFEFKVKDVGHMPGGDDVQSSLDRYPYQEVAAIDWRILLSQVMSNRLHWRTRYNYSIPERGGWLSSSFEWAKGPLTFALGLDVLGAEVEPNSAQAGLFSRYRANDRVFGGMSYVF